MWQFVEALRQWTNRNPIPLENKRKLNPTKKERLYLTSQDDSNPKTSVCCSKKYHKSRDFKTLPE